ncbi:hypothetical protein [Blastococcus capsensis]|uniref:hypothetical protein n=1 Tax=Blastococcus capsensis TaxID=1564163 RepID=UPI0025408CA2|nr:hypothetical protein [Blastococcus capsensis]MDK3258853.1 hypothetical protein [Blastococcus capsensis]
MSQGQKIGVASAGIAVALWLLFVILSVATAVAGEGVNIGATLIAFLALGLSILAAVALVVSVDDVAVRASGAVSIAAWVIFATLTFSGAAPESMHLVPAVIAILALSICGLLAAKMRPRGR